MLRFLVSRMTCQSRNGFLISLLKVPFCKTSASVIWKITEFLKSFTNIKKSLLLITESYKEGAFIYLTEHDVRTDKFNVIDECRYLSCTITFKQIMNWFWPASTNKCKKLCTHLFRLLCSGYSTIWGVRWPIDNSLPTPPLQNVFSYLLPFRKLSDSWFLDPQDLSKN